MNALIRGLSALAVCSSASVASAQSAENNPIQAAPAVSPAAPVVSSVSPAGPRTVSLAPQERENLPAAERHWYGWQILSVDGGAATLALAAAALDSSSDPDHSENLSQALLLGAAVGYVAGSPTIHLIHRQYWRGLGSLGLRAGLPIVGGAIGLGSATCPPPGGGDYGNCGLGELIVGAAAGTVLAIVLDNSLLAWEPNQDEADKVARLGVAPVVGSDGRRELRLFGTF